MGERVYVTLTLLASQEKEAKAFFKDTEYHVVWVGKQDGEEIIDLGFEQVNYGDLEFIDDLAQAGIAFTSQYDAGSDWPAGRVYIRFTKDGLLQRIHLPDTEVNPPIGELMTRIDAPNELRNYIIDWQANTTPLPWTNQQEYGLRYRTLQLINN